jgi:hypothetical protein
MIQNENGFTMISVLQQASRLYIYIPLLVEGHDPNRSRWIYQSIFKTDQNTNTASLISQLSISVSLLLVPLFSGQQSDNPTVSNHTISINDSLHLLPNEY